MDDHIRGSLDAPVVLIEYGDFECPYCATAYRHVKHAAQKFGDQLAEVFRQFPLVEIHPHAMHAAQAAEAASLQRKFWPMHDVLFEHSQRLDDDNLWSYADGLGLNLDRFERDFRSPAVVNRIAQYVETGLRDGVQGTPTFFLNGERLQLERFEDLEPAIERALTEKQRV